MLMPLLAKLLGASATLVASLMCLLAAVGQWAYCITSLPLVFTLAIAALHYRHKAAAWAAAHTRKSSLESRLR